MKMFRIISVSLIVCITGVVYAMAGESIELVGTDDGEAVFEAVAEAFNALNPDGEITIPDDIGSAGGIKAVGRDQAVLARVARQIRKNEEAYGLSYIPFATTPVAFFTHKESGVQELSTQQVLDIYSGQITDWSEVGGQNGRIRVMNHEEGDSSLEVLEESFPGFDDLTVTSKSKTIYEDNEAIKLAENTQGVIAYGNASNADEADVIVLSINGKNPSDKDYPYTTTLGFVFKEGNFDGLLKQFIEFATSDAAHEAILKAGGVPLAE